jgi:hypothetical protein
MLPELRPRQCCTSIGRVRLMRKLRLVELLIGESTGVNSRAAGYCGTRWAEALVRDGRAFLNCVALLRQLANYI